MFASICKTLLSGLIAAVFLGGVVWATGPITFTSASGQSVWLTRAAGSMLSLYQPGDEQARFTIKSDGTVLLSDGEPTDPGPFPMAFGYTPVEQADGIERSIFEISGRQDMGINLNNMEDRLSVSMVVQDCEVRFINETAGNMHVFHAIPITGGGC